MKFKIYQTTKTKHYIKNFSLFVITNNINWSFKNVTIKQKLKKLKLNCYKIYNKLTIKIFKNSVYKNLTKLIYSSVFFLIPQNRFIIEILKHLKLLSFLILGIKLNKKLYSTAQIKNITSLNYQNEISVLYQFLIINLKQVQTI